ncbi:hypothetical protein [uncultured Psychroserpens sp.]|uniref:toxin-antitoxin system YwqK family antitoxin n=1 Tax=uncultured Psychroserpens sp. TaxID=255436 RepID=UPI00261FEA1F|nr:hypothetical protein [uncultured Psychroserpens sp.]
MRPLVIIILFFFILSSCQQEKKEDTESFIFLERHGYIVDSYNGVSVYRLADTGKIMHGYYVISNEYGKSEEFNVSEGILDGVNITFHDNNEMYSKTFYNKGRRHGEDLTYYQSGKLQKKTIYKNNILVGPQTHYFESGQIQTESKIKDEKVVESTSYDIIGNIVSQRFIKDGRTITQSIKNGIVISEHIDSNYDDFDAMKFYNSKGEVEMFLRMYDNGNTRFLIELDENENEIKRINIKENPQKILEYQQYLSRL